ncbi:MAG: phosphopantetheine-binding protein [Hungatella sp.]|jgi:acyl carrier protein|nr:phosphopantetheine-binding protein [Hungatella sp.]MDR1549450.1 phosphopantetheine-binding protein [Hungatella sp.]
MRQLNKETKKEIKDMVYDFLADECEVSVTELKEDLSVIDDLDGDSLMFVEMIEQLKKKYGLNIQMQNIGKYLLKNPANTIREVVETAWLVYEKENDIVEAL